MFSWEFCEIFKNIFFTEHLPATASELTRIVKRRSRNIFITPKENLVALEATSRGCFVKKVFLKISQNSQESTFARASSLIKLQELGL